MARMSKTKKTEDHFIKALNPKDTSPYCGDEPVFPTQPIPENRLSAMIKAFSWYNSYYGKKDAKDLMISYLGHKDRKEEAKQIAKVSENEFRLPFCWLARMNLRGFESSKEESIRCEDEIKRLIDTLTEAELAISLTGKVESTRPNIQEILREKATLAGGELEGMLDDYILQGAKASHSFRPIDELKKVNVVAQHVAPLMQSWKVKVAELVAATKGKDEQLVEGYSFLTKMQLKNLLKFSESVVNDLTSYVNLKKASKSPRKRKSIPIEKIVAKLKYIKTFTDASIKLDLISVHPTKLHGATEAWVYDTAKRKLHHYVAEDHSGSFTVKGNTLLGFDTTASQVKTLRKPAEQIKEVMGSKPTARKFFNSIKAVATTPKGRFNQDMIILKAF